MTRYFLRGERRELLRVETHSVDEYDLSAETVFLGNAQIVRVHYREQRRVSADKLFKHKIHSAACAAVVVEKVAVAYVTALRPFAARKYHRHSASEARKRGIGVDRVVALPADKLGKPEDDRDIRGRQQSLAKAQTRVNHAVKRKVAVRRGVDFNSAVEQPLYIRNMEVLEVRAFRSRH